MQANQATEVRVAGVRNVAIQINAEDTQGEGEDQLTGEQIATSIGVTIGVPTYNPSLFEYLLDNEIKHGDWVQSESVFASKEDLLASL